jgi:two-component system sensor kinase FixL
MPDLAKARSAANEMISDANRDWEIVRRLRALSRKADPEYRYLNIDDLVTETIPPLRREIPRHGAALRLDLHSDVAPVAGDKVQLQQVVINLVVDGIQAMAGTIGRENSLTIRSRRRRGNGVSVSVIDNGTGIDSRRLDTLFDAFFTTKPAGMGMGLSICRSIIEAHCGKVGASNNPDLGPPSILCFQSFPRNVKTRRHKGFFDVPQLRGAGHGGDEPQSHPANGGLLAVPSAVSVECGRASAATGCAAMPINK